MPPVTNGRVLFNSIPEHYPVPNETVIYDTSEEIDIENVPLNGGILLKTLELSVDPYMRGRMRDASIQSYMGAFTLHESITGFGVAVVVRSENPEAKKGDYVSGMIKYQQYSIVKDLTSSFCSKFENPEKLPLSTFIGVLGMPGKTAFMAWKEYSHAEKGEVVFVSTGGGPVGSLVIQLAKMDGLKVIGSAGSADKLEFMKECGADVVFNYKEEKVADVLGREGPIDIYWDNVGGETLEAALNASNVNGRFIECGMIAEYNGAQRLPIKNLMQVIAKSLSINGFIQGRLEVKHGQDFFKTIPPLVSNGTIKHKEHIFDGLEKVGDAIIAVQKGENKAKAVVHVADE